MLPLAKGTDDREGNLLILGDDERAASLNTGSHLAINLTVGISR